MKRHLLMLGAAVALLLSADSAYPQSTPATFKVPFAFVAGTTTLPAGEYHISNGPAPGTLGLRGDDRHTIQVTTGNLETLDASAQTKLVFHRYGNRYFLAQLWIEGNNSGREVPISRQEREMAKKSTPELMTVVTVSTQAAQ
jgi:hypothetical protein